MAGIPATRQSVGSKDSSSHKANSSLPPARGGWIPVTRTGMTAEGKTPTSTCGGVPKPYPDAVRLPQAAAPHSSPPPPDRPPAARRTPSAPAPARPDASARSSSMKASHIGGPPSSSSSARIDSSSRRRRVPPAPGAHLREQRHELDGRLRQAVDGLLLVARIVAPRQQAGRDQPLQPVGQDVRGDALLRSASAARGSGGGCRTSCRG